MFPSLARQEHYPGLRWATRRPFEIGKGFTDRRLYQVPVAISNNKTVGNGGINKSAVAAASPVGRACCGGSLEGEIRYGRTGQRFNYAARQPGNTAGDGA